MAGPEAAARPRPMLSAVTRAVPRGRGLTDEVWRTRHIAILCLAWAHTVGVPAYGIMMGWPVPHALLEGAPIGLFALLGTFPRASRRLRATGSSAALLTSSAVLVHFSDGLIEMHFHFFVMVPVIALYQDWAPFLLAFLYVLVHHGLVGQLAPELVFNHPWGQRKPWTWAGVHALFIGGISLACLATWRINELHVARSKRAESDVREEKRVVERLHAIGTGIVAELELERVSQLVTDEAVAATRAAFGAFFYNVYDERGEGYMLYSISGAARSDFESFPMPRNTRIFEPTFSGTSVVRIADVTADERYGQNPPYLGMPPGHLPVRSYLAVPVHARGSSEVLGGLFFGHPEPGVFTDRDERVAVGIATQAAVAFDNARLYEAERRAKTAADQATARLSMLAETGRLISSSLDQDVTLRDLARLAVPTLADACLIDVIADDATVRRIAAAAPSIEHLVERLAALAPDPDDHEHPVIRVMRTEKSLYVEDVDEAFIGAVIPGRAHRSDAEDLAPRSAVIVPLTGRGTTYGALSVIDVDGSGRHLSRDDVPLVEEVGRRAGIAIENARLYERQRSVAESLQRALLPQTLPEIPGFAAAARYLPAGPGDRIGGDWYDLFETPSGEIAAVMGDVAGHGVPAASTMAKLRNAARAYIWEGLGPSEVLGRLNRLLHGLRPESLATAGIGLLDPITTRVRLASAGHPPLLHVGHGGEATLVGTGLGPPLGAVPFAPYGEEVIDLAVGDTLVFYTDGLVEDRNTPLDRGIERMRSAVASSAPTVDALTDRIVAACTEGREVSDDIALLLLRALPMGSRLRLVLPAEPKVLASLRQTMRRWLRENGVADGDAQDVLIACGEACNNAIEHGELTGGSTFEVEAEIDGDLRLAVRNVGAWRAPRADGGGRGIPVMRALMDEVDIDRRPDGVEIRLRRSLGRSRSMS